MIYHDNLLTVKPKNINNKWSGTNFSQKITILLELEKVYNISKCTYIVHSYYGDNNLQHSYSLHFSGSLPLLEIIFI